MLFAELDLFTKMFLWMLLGMLCIMHVLKKAASNSAVQKSAGNFFLNLFKK